jgi:hypothetical protein
MKCKLLYPAGCDPIFRQTSRTSRRGRMARLERMESNRCQKEAAKNSLRVGKLYIILALVKWGSFGKSLSAASQKASSASRDMGPMVNDSKGHRGDADIMNATETVKC